MLGPGQGPAAETPLFPAIVPPAPPDNRWRVRATFRDPGTYVLRCLAHDGDLATAEDITVVVTR
jgi:hypothetical protein